MNLKTEFRRLFRESFKVDPKWTDWFMNEVYSDREALVLDIDGKVVSAMLLSEYHMTFHGTELPAAYISCVATARSERGKGLMHRLFPRALNTARERGFAFATLIPATRRLYFFYDRFGFSTVFYAREMRYTSVHAFPIAEGFVSVEPDYDIFSRLEQQAACTIRHSRERFDQVLTDYRLSGGLVLAVEGPGGHCAMAFVQLGHEAKVTRLMADTPEAADAVLAVMRSRVGEKPVILSGAPEDSDAPLADGPVYGARRNMSLFARGMARIINVPAVLEALAAANPTLDQVIRVHDHIIPDNNGIYTVSKGTCTLTPDTTRRITLDVGVDVLTSLIFSAPATGQLFGLPSMRPEMSLMLE